MGWNPVKEAEKKAKRAIDKIINPAVSAGKRAVDKVGDAAEEGIRSARRKAEQGLHTVGDEVLDQIRSAGHEIEEGLTEKLPDLVEDAFEKLAADATKNAAKQALETAADIIETTAPDTYTLTLGIELALVVQAEVTVSLELPNPVARISKIRAWAAKAPSGRAKIMECVKDFAPSALTVEAKISGNGGSATYSGDHLYDGLDAFLRKHGVD